MNFPICSTEVVLLIREDLVFESEVMGKSDYSRWGRGLLGWTKWYKESLDSNFVSPEYLFMQKRTGSVGKTEQGLPLKYSGVHLWSNGGWTTASENAAVNQRERAVKCGTGARGCSSGLGCCRQMCRACSPLPNGLASPSTGTNTPAMAGWQSQEA